jgi:hypothetical protein
LTKRAALTLPPPAAGRSGPEGRRQYESLRREALEPGSHVELSLIARQGLAAWLAGTPDRPADGAEPARPPSEQPELARPPQRTLIRLLAGLVLGDRQEPHDDR